VIKDASSALVEVGDFFTYTIQVLNKGAPGVNAGSLEDAHNVVITDTLPVDVELLLVTVDGVSVPFTVDPITRQFAITLGTMAAEQTSTIVLTARLDDVLSPIFDPGPDRFFLINTAAGTLDEPDPTPLDNIDTAVIIPTDRGATPSPDLVVTKTSAIEQAGGGDLVVFTITAENQGGRVAASVSVIDSIDTKSFEFVSASSGGVFVTATGDVVGNWIRFRPMTACRNSPWS
jgi:uncharacterized repeat protein (TIGR01451 family)